MIRPVLAALGLSTASGLNASVTLFLLGAFARWTGFVKLAHPYDKLAEPGILLLLAVLVVVEFFADKIPLVDHSWHAIGLIVHPLTGALASAAVNSASDGLDPTVSAICGAVVSFFAHATRAVIRPFVTALTAGLGNWAVSLIEDGIALVLALLAIIVPILAVLLIVVLTVLFARTIGRGWRRLFRKKLRPPPLPLRRRSGSRLRPPPLPRRRR
jgi:Domain of unknown function (DUF4126)